MEIGSGVKNSRPSLGRSTCRASYSSSDCDEALADLDSSEEDLEDEVEE